MRENSREFIFPKEFELKFDSEHRVLRVRADKLDKILTFKAINAKNSPPLRNVTSGTDFVAFSDDNVIEIEILVIIFDL